MAGYLPKRRLRRGRWPREAPVATRLPAFFSQFPCRHALLLSPWLTQRTQVAQKLPWREWKLAGRLARLALAGVGRLVGSGGGAVARLFRLHSDELQGG